MVWSRIYPKTPGYDHIASLKRITGKHVYFSASQVHWPETGQCNGSESFPLAGNSLKIGFIHLSHAIIESKSWSTSVTSNNWWISLTWIFQYYCSKSTCGSKHVQTQPEFYPFIFIYQTTLLIKTYLLQPPIATNRMTKMFLITNREWMMSRVHYYSWWKIRPPLRNV